MALNRAGARAAVAAWFAPGAVPGLCWVYTAFPRSIPVANYTSDMPANTLSGAVGIVHLVTSAEVRRSIGGAHGGKKHTTYDCELQIVGRSTQKLGEDAMADFDAVIDGAVTRLRADRTLASGDVFQAGEAYINVESAEPDFKLGLTWTWSAIKFDLSQFVNA